MPSPPRTSTTDDGTYTRSIATGTVSPMCHRVALDDLIFPGLVVETVSASFNGRLEISYSLPNNGGGGRSDTTISASHEHVIYNGENLPPGLIGSGWTHVVKTVDGVVSDTWHDDPSGAVYEALYVDYGDEFDYDALDFHGEIGNGSAAFRYARRNETITKRTEKFTVGE